MWRVLFLLGSVDLLVLQSFLALRQLYQLICMILIQGIHFLLHNFLPLFLCSSSITYSKHSGSKSSDIITTNSSEGYLVEGTQFLLDLLCGTIGGTSHTGGC
ncbi:hypothetical protein GUJ93_ZPchr0006g42156 [Zizania palustris]|uniref:Uncharacterized protein n=1 Tax=Zizania palustris TaxID=103762 RepID=A0A8J5SDM0_ZIZPA|nr:hypothetical protein GUJ93_ZPchr0006g42156 [Zizania palustris]